MKLERPAYMTDEQWEGAQQWIRSRPKKVRDVIEHYPPWGQYRLKETGQEGRIYSYEQHKSGAVTVKFDTTDLLEILPLRVFGIDPASLERIDQ